MARQMEVVRLLDEGLTNAELAQRLYLSAKTVDHHVSARDAARKARELGILESGAVGAR